MASSAVDIESQTDLQTQISSNLSYQTDPSSNSNHFTSASDSSGPPTLHGFYLAPGYTPIYQPASNVDRPVSPSGSHSHPLKVLTTPIFTPDYNPHEPYIPPRPFTPIFRWHESDNDERFSSNTHCNRIWKAIRLFTWRNLIILLKGSLPFICFFGIFFFFIYYSHFNNKLLTYYNYSNGF